jgi:trimeric autotransporter adhesin
MKFPIIYIILLFCSVQLQAITVVPSTKFVVLSGTQVAQTTPARRIALQINSHALDLSVNTTGVLEVSLDSINFSANLQIPPSNINIIQNLYIRAKPVLKDKVFKEQVFFVHNITDTSFNRIYVQGSSMVADSFYTVLSWNTKWFGDPFGCSCDTAVQLRNIKNILLEIIPDVIALQEVVNVSNVVGVANSLGPNYSSNFSTYCSFALNVSDPDFAEGQKLAYIYNNKLFNSISTFGLCKSTTSTIGTNSGSPYSTFSSGRFPYAMLSTIQSTGDTILFLNLHAKAGATNSDYYRRESGAVLIADSVLTQHQNKQVMLLGDYNDLLEGTIVNTQSNSPYAYLLSNGFNGLSLPSLYPNTSTYVSIANSLIDNLAVNKKMMSNYASGTVTVLNQLPSAFFNYDDSISDHVPVMAYYRKYNNAAPTSIASISDLHESIFLAYTGNKISAIFPTSVHSFKYKLIDMQGKTILYEQNVSHLELETNNFISGIYILQITWEGKDFFIKISI